LACHLDYAIYDDAFDMPYVCWVVSTNLAMLKKDLMKGLNSIDMVRRDVVHSFRNDAVQCIMIAHVS